MASPLDLGLRGDLSAHQAQLRKPQPMRSFKRRLLNAQVLRTAPNRVTCASPLALAVTFAAAQLGIRCKDH